MTIPINPVNINPQVIEDPTTARFLKMLLAGADIAQRGQQIELEKQRVKVQQQQVKLAEMQFQSEQSQLADQGNALMQTLLSGEPQGTATVPELPVVTQGGGAIPEQQFQAPVSPLATTLRTMDPRSIPGFVQRAAPFIEDQRKERAIAANAQAIEGIVGRLPEGVRGQFRDYANLRLRGVEVPLDIARTTYPDLFPDGVDPSVVTNALNGFIRSDGVLSVGDAARLADPTGRYAAMIPNDLRGLRMSPAGGGTGSIKEQQAKAGIHYIAMTSGNATLAELQDKGVRVSFRGDIARRLMTGARGGGPITTLEDFLNMVNYATLPQEQQELLVAALSTGNAFRYQVSGQQTSDRELGFILAYIIPVFGDSEVTLNQKRLFRAMMEEATRATYENRLLGSEAVAELRRQAQDLGAPQSVLATLEVMERNARLHQSLGSPFQPSDQPGGNQDVGNAVNSLRLMLEQQETARRQAERRREIGR